MSNTLKILSQPNTLRIAHTGLQGGGGSGQSGVAVGPISALRAITAAAAGLGYCIPGQALAGISISAAADGATLSYASSGIVDVAGLALPGDSWIYLAAANGALTGLRPSSGTLQIIGKTNADASRLTLAPSLPLSLA